MEQEVSLKNIVLTRPIINAIKQINPSAVLKGYKVSSGEQGFILHKLDENLEKDMSTMPPVELKQRSDGYYEIQNGRHRVAISIARGLETIKAVIMNTGGSYLPTRYFSGLSQKKRTQRKKEIKSRSKLSWKSPFAYRPFKTDKGVKTRRSSHVSRFKKMFPNVHSLEGASKATGVPLSLIRKSYNRGMAAWRTGHRPGATQQQWGYARAYSMLTCGKTHYTTDSDLVKKAKKTKKGNAWFKKTCSRYNK